MSSVDKTTEDGKMQGVGCGGGFASLLAKRDPLELMNELCRWPEPPEYDERWAKKVAAACEVAAIHAVEMDRLRYALKWLESQGFIAAFHVTQALNEANTEISRRSGERG